jgi:phosphohistidine phosphatase
MDLILWRHAEAADGLPDIKRELTRKGLKQARDMAAWLQPRLPGPVSVIASPAERTLQTAGAFAHDFVVNGSVAPGAPAQAVLDAAGWPDAPGPVILVGHQPTLGEAAAMLLTGKPLPWSIKKGAIWWFRRRVRDGHARVVLRAVMSPEFLR